LHQYNLGNIFHIIGLSASVVKSVSLQIYSLLACGNHYRRRRRPALSLVSDLTMHRAAAATSDVDLADAAAS
jgi:hypothetical protein